MDNQHNIESKSLRDHAWTTDEIRKHSSSWTLAGDIGLFNLLNEFSHNIISRTHEVENAVDSLVHQTKMTSAKINNVINDFHMLSNLQFVENRVYDEEVQESVQDSKHVVEKTKEQREAEMLPKFVKAIELGLAVLDTQFDKINVNEISDSEDEDISSEGRTILEPKDPYEHRPLPFIIGSEQFMKCDYAGLKELVEDDIQSFSEESSISETDETSTDEGEPLPLDDDDDRFSAKQIDKVSQNISEKISSSDESELFGSEKEVNGFVSDSSLDLNAKENIQRLPSVGPPTKETYQDSVASLQSKLKLPQVLPVPKMQKKEKEEELFTNEAENSDDETPFRKKTGLFTSEIRFDDEKEGSDLFGDDLFGNSRSKDVKEIKPVVQHTISSEKIPIVPATALDTKKLTLFDNDEDSEDDIFNTVIKTKKLTSSKISNAGSQDSSEKADTSSTPSSAPSTKPSGNAFDFVTGTHNDALFGDDSDGDDLFTNKKTSPGKKLEIDNSEDDLFGIITSQPIKETKVTAQIKPSLFEDSKVSNQQMKKETQKYLPTKTKDSIFGDSDSSDQEKSATLKPLISASVKAKKEQNLFDDDFDDDIFMQDTKKPQETVKTNIIRADEKVEKKIVDEKSLFEEKSKQINKKESTVKKSTTLSIFDDSEEIFKEESTVKKTMTPSIVDDSEETKKELTVKKPKTPSIFDDPEELFFNNLTQEESSKSLLRKNQNKPFSLFEESDNFDLFSAKPLVSESKSTVPAQISVPKSGIESTKIPEQTNGIVTSKVSSVKDTNINNEVSFETPVDNTNVLSVINKSRVKVGTKRRKPTRQGRLAALQNSEKEANADTKPDLRTDGNISDKSFSASVTTEVQDEPPKLDYKAQEKKKKNLMSQLMSEVTVSKIALNKTSEKVDEMQDEDEIDIFSEAARKGKSKSSFSFVPSDKNEIASMFPVENKDDIQEDFNVSKSDSFDDNFFTEPAFQNFRSSISHKDPVLDLEDSDEDDDLFRTVKTSILPRAKPDTSDPNDLFDDDTDIFANIQKEKYEMFPNQMYEDEDDDDIFKSITAKSSGSSKAINTSSIKKVDTQQVKAFDDPLTGLLGDD